MRHILLAMWLALVALAAPLSAQTFPERGQSAVIDEAGLLRPEQVLDLESKADALLSTSDRAFVVVTVKDLQGLTVEDYGGRLLRHLGVGDAERDDGVILLVAPNEKKVRIETGYGAEGFLPDILAGRIVRDTILPRFRANDMAGGIMAGADAIVRQMSLPPGEARAEVERAKARPNREGRTISITPMIFWGMIAVFVVLSMGRRASGRRYRSSRGRRRRKGMDSGDLAVLLWGLDAFGRGISRRGGGGGFGGFGGGGLGGGGGFGGFGGGSGGGGGASGSW